MKIKRTKIILFALAAAVLLSCTAYVTASYSSEDDPLITLSYLTDILVPQIKEQIISSLSGDHVLVEKPPAQDQADSEPGGEVPPGENTRGENSPAPDLTYQVVELTYGQKVLAKGSVELILRPGGGAAVISPFAAQGISDLTGGGELYDGDALSCNHYCLIPRGDGRGILITTDIAYIMVRGEFEIGE